MGGDALLYPSPNIGPRSDSLTPHCLASGQIKEENVLPLLQTICVTREPDWSGAPCLYGGCQLVTSIVVEHRLREPL